MISVIFKMPRSGGSTAMKYDPKMFKGSFTHLPSVGADERLLNVPRVLPVYVYLQPYLVPTGSVRKFIANTINSLLKHLQIHTPANGKG